MSGASVAAIATAASQSTVFVTVGNSGSAYGVNISGAYGSVSPSAIYGKSFAYVLNQSNGFFVALTHGGTPLAQSAFRGVRVVGAGGTSYFSTDTLGSSGTFTADAGGVRSEWRWDGTGIDAMPWGASDTGEVRVVAFFR